MSAGRFDCMPQRDHRQSVRSAGIFLLQRNAHLASCPSRNGGFISAERSGDRRAGPGRAGASSAQRDHEAGWVPFNG